MQKSTLPQGVKTLKIWYEDKQQLRFDLPVQRNSGQWSNLQKSLLIHSLLSQFPVPSIYLIKQKAGEDSGKDVYLYQALDGKQRLTSIFEFINGEYALHSATPEAIVEGTSYDLAGLTYKELSEECKDEILGYRFSIYNLESCTEEEIEEVFKRLNNSTPLTAIQKVRTVLGSELVQWSKETLQSNFFTKSINLTLAQARKEADLEILLQSMMLLDARHENYSYKAISSIEVTQYCEHIRNKYNDEKRLMIMEILEYLENAFPEQHKWLKKSNCPMIFVLAKLALEQDIEAGCFKVFISNFDSKYTPECEYAMYSGSGNTKVVNTQGRLRVLCQEFSEYFSLSGVSILSKRESCEEGEESEEVVIQQLADILMNNLDSEENGEKVKGYSRGNQNSKDNIDDSSIAEQSNISGNFNLNGESDED